MFRMSIVLMTTLVPSIALAATTTLTSPNNGTAATTSPTVTWSTSCAPGACTFTLQMSADSTFTTGVYTAPTTTGTSAALSAGDWAAVSSGEGRAAVWARVTWTGAGGGTSTNTRVIQPVVGVWEGAAAADDFGGNMILGDVTGDGIEDVWVGAARFDDPRDDGAPGTEADAGTVYVFAGPVAAGGSPSSAVATFTGDVGARLGTAMTTGDFNGDGWIDVAIGAPRWSGTGSNRGAVYVWLADSAAGFAGTYDVSDADLVMEGDTTEGILGWSMAAGDFDEDGIDDLIVGEPGDTTLPGAARLLYGDVAFGGLLLGSDADASFVGVGDDTLGYAVASGPHGHRSGDWFTLGAPGHDSHGVDGGAVYTFLMSWNGRLSGSQTAAAAFPYWMWGEAAGDRFGTAIASIENAYFGATCGVVGAPGAGVDDTGTVYLYGTLPAGLYLGSSAAALGFGGAPGVDPSERCGTSVGPAGDFAGDGSTEVFVTCRGGTGQRGRIYVVDPEEWYLAPDLLDISLLVVDGPASDAELGTSAVSLGDLDADGDGELLVGIPKGTTAAGVVTGVARTIAGGL